LFVCSFVCLLYEGQPVNTSAETSSRIALVSIARPTFDVELAQATANTLHAQLCAAGYTLVGPGAALLMDAESVERALEQLADQSFDLVLALQASFADSSMILRVAQVAQSAGAPLLLWAVPEERSGERLRLNSLCGINLAAHALKRHNLAYDYVLAAPDDTAAIARAGVLARAGAARRALRHARIGVVGAHPVGFDPCAYDADVISTLFGAQITAIDLTAALADARSVDSAQRAAFVQRIAACASNLAELDQTAVQGTAGVYAALRQYVESQGLSGVAVRCWPEYFTELGCAACGAMSMLNDEHIPAGCEADVNGTLTLVMLRALSDAPVFIADLVAIDADDDSAVLWHCGLAPASMADPNASIRATVHSNRKLPLLLEFPLRPGRVTFARLTQSRLEDGVAGYRLVIGGGEMLARPCSFSGTSGVARFDRPVTSVFDTIMREGLEHHICLVYGDYRAELRALAELLGVRVVAL
jgi:L-fucose isomerase-like protein